MRFFASLCALALPGPLSAIAVTLAEKRLGFVVLHECKTFDRCKRAGNGEIQDGAFARF